MKLRNLILLTTILITTSTVLVLGYAFGSQFEKMLTERMVDDYQDTVNAMQNNVETLVLYAQDFTKYMSLDERVLDAIQEYQSMSEESKILNRVKMKQKWDKISNKLIFSTSMIYSLEIYNGDILEYSYYDDPSVDETKTIPDDVLRAALSQSPPIWTGLLTLKQYRSYAKSTDYGFAVVKSVRDEAEQRIGAIAIYIRESSFSDILESANQVSNSRFYLVDSDNQILSAVDNAELGHDIRETLKLSSKDFETCIQDGILLKEQKGQDLLYVSRDIEMAGVRLVCETTLEELGRQQREARGFMGALTFLSVALAVVSSWLVSRSITKPLGKLMDVMGQIKDDENSIHLRFSEGNAGEIGILGSRFNELMDELDASMNRIYEEQRQRRHNEVRLLQAQIVPHFLYNTMGIISSFIKLGMSDKALETIQNLVSFYRLSLSSGKDIITLREEVELTRNYMELQQLRYIEYMEYVIECDEPAEDAWVPKLTIQPLVENVLHHGLKPGSGKCQIRVSVTLEQEEGAIRIVVHDNGAGIKEERLRQLRQSLESGESVTKSFGIININQRMKLIYGHSYHMEIESTEGQYTQFTLCLPLEYKYGDEKDV